MGELNTRMTQHWWNLHLESMGIGNKIADTVTTWTGSFAAFGLSVFIVVLWGMLGPHFNYADTWQLVINTGTTIVTFLMVFLIQNNQNRQAERDWHQAEVDYQTNVAAKEEIEDLQIALTRIETEKIDALDRKLDEMLEHVQGLSDKVHKVETEQRHQEYRRNFGG